MSDWNTLSDAEKKDQLNRQEIAGKLEQAQAFLRITARSNYFTGYSITETINDRINAIGKDKKVRPDRATDSTDDSYYTSEELDRTQLGRLAAFEKMVNDAVAAALELET
jgi:hypothetical protein